MQLILPKKNGNNIKKKDYEFIIQTKRRANNYNGNKNIYGDILHSISKYDNTHSTKELLEIFKKEKGL